MSDIIKEKGNVLSFTLFNINKGREKICKCNPPRYEIDTVNRIVTCMDCGAILDAFEALIALCQHMAEYEEYQQKALEKCKIYGELADKEYHRRMKNKALKEVDKQYQSGMLPICPKCGKAIEPMEITNYIHKRFLEG